MSIRDIAAVLSFSTVAIFFILSAFMIHPFGIPEETDMDDNIINNVQTETGANNAVKSVLFDYRGFDTLGEATILFTAVVAVIMVFRRLKK